MAPGWARRRRQGDVPTPLAIPQAIREGVRGARPAAVSPSTTPCTRVESPRQPQTTHATQQETEKIIERIIYSRRLKSLYGQISIRKRLLLKDIQNIYDEMYLLQEKVAHLHRNIALYDTSSQLLFPYLPSPWQNKYEQEEKTGLKTAFNPGLNESELESELESESETDSESLKTPNNSERKSTQLTHKEKTRTPIKHDKKTTVLQEDLSEFSKTEKSMENYL